MPGRLHGSAHDAGRRPVAGALVRLLPLGGAPPVPELAVLTGDDGRFAWPAPLPEGRYLVVVATATGSAERQVAVRPGRTTEAELRG